MRADIVWWDLSASGQTIESLREYLREESVSAFSGVPGLRFKMWLSDPDANRWGAVLLWESEEASLQQLPSRALELIGYPPAVAHGFDVEATAEGQYEIQQLALRGMAFAKTKQAGQERSSDSGEVAGLSLGREPLPTADQR